MSQFVELFGVDGTTVNRTDLENGSDLVPGKTYTVATSVIIDNQPAGANSDAWTKGRFHVSYENLDPVDGDGGSYQLQAVLEREDGTWQQTSCYQFSPVTGRASHPTEREISMREDQLLLETGVDDIVYFLNKEQKRISRTPDKLPASRLRVVILLMDLDPTNVSSRFNSVTVKGQGELWSPGQ